MTLLDRLAQVADYSNVGPEWTGCVCGNDWILIPVAFDTDGEINSYGTVGFCSVCGAAITVPTPTKGQEFDGDRLHGPDNGPGSGGSGVSGPC